jgi:hypothetical protein
MDYATFQAKRGQFTQRTGYQPDHCRIAEADAGELLQTAGADARLVKDGDNASYAMVSGVPVLIDATVAKGEAIFETRPRMPYEAAPAYQKPRQPRQQ